MGNLAFDLEDRFINKAFIIVSAMLCYVYNCRCGFIRTGGVIVEVALLQGKHFDTKPIKRVIRSSEGHSGRKTRSAAQTQYREYLMAYLTINGLNIYYEMHGEGETILLLHHGFGCTRMWKTIYHGLVKGGYCAVMYDRRGYGRSEEGPDFDRFYTSPSFRAEGIKELETVRKMLGLESFHLVGQCEGGVVSVDYATRYPKQVQSITISSTQCYNDIPIPELNRKMFPKPLRELDPGLQEKMAEWHGRERAGRFFDMFRDRGGSYGTGVFDMRPILPAVTCPVLVLYPDRSALFDVEQGVAFYHHLPNSELAVLPKCGHNTYENQPVEYVRNVLSFLERQKTYVPPEYFNATCVAPEC